MNAERLLQHYEQIADAPDAITRLRRFILDLAVRGKLVPQDPSDEPSSQLLKRIAAEKASLLGAGKLKAEKPVKQAFQAGEPYGLPALWRWADLQSLCLSVTDGDHLPPPKADKGVPFLVIGDVRDKAINYDCGRFVERAYYEKLDVIRRPRKGDILYTLVGSFGIPVPVREDREFCVQRHIGILRPSEILPVAFLTYTLESNLVFSQADKFATGIAQRTVPLAGLRAIQVPLPPLAEQNRIVAKVEELMTLCDALETARTERETKRDRLAAASLARLNTPDPETFRDDARFALDALPTLTSRPDQIKQLRQTILNLAVRGKLVPQDPADEPAEELLKRIAGKKADKTRRAELRRNGLPDASLRREEELEPCNWTWTQLGDVALSMRYGTSVKCDYGTKGAPVLRIPNVSAGRISLDDIKFGPLSPTEIQDLSLLAGDILLIRSNGSLEIVGRAAVVTPDAIGMSFAGYLVRLRTDPTEIDPAYIWLALQSSEVRDQIEHPIRSAVGLKNVNLTEFGALTFRLPPLAEQHRIVAKVDELMALCDQLESSLSTADETRNNLLDALLAEALAPVNAKAMQEAAE